MCPKGHNCFINWSDFKQNHGCSICGNDSISDKIKGENNSNSTLITQDIIQIKLLLKEGKLLQREIADIFEVSQISISRIKTGITWSYIKI